MTVKSYSKSSAWQRSKRATTTMGDAVKAPASDRPQAKRVWARSLSCNYAHFAIWRGRWAWAPRVLLLQGRTEIEAPGTPGRNGCDLGGEHSWFPTLAVSRPCFGWRHPAQRLLWRCRSVCHDAWRERIEVRVRPCRALVSNVMFRSDVCIDAGVRHRAATASTRRSGC